MFELLRTKTVPVPFLGDLTSLQAIGLFAAALVASYLVLRVVVFVPKVLEWICFGSLLAIVIAVALAIDKGQRCHYLGGIWRPCALGSVSLALLMWGIACRTVPFRITRPRVVSQHWRLLTTYLFIGFAVGSGCSFEFLMPAYHTTGILVGAVCGIAALVWAVYFGKALADYY